jgi:hypothetical protein
MAFSEEIFEVKDSQQRSMYGIIHHPPNPNGALVITFNIGLHYRVSHSLLFVRQARDLQKGGFTVVRFDPTRIGYSHGDILPGRSIDNFDAVQTGLFKDDTLTVLDYLRNSLNPRKIFFSGLCGGALTAIISAAVDKNIDGMIFIAGPITVTSPEYERSTLHPFEADILFSGYLRKMFSPKAWVRFVSGKTSYSDLVNAIKVKLTHRRPRESVESSKSADGALENENKGNILNHTFVQAFEELIMAGRHVLFLMPELDRATYDFDELLADELARKYAAYKKYYDIARVPRANHTFSRPESARQLFDISREWLLSRFNE